MLEGVKPTPPIKKKQTEEASKAKSRARNQEAGHGGPRAFYRELAENYEREGEIGVSGGTDDGDGV